MDNFLIDYLKSGTAWVLVGSGPSIEMGYPSWERLALTAWETVKIEARGHDPKQIRAAFNARDFPTVFEEAKRMLGLPRLRDCLQRQLQPTSFLGKIYEMITRWPVPVYLTTNYDDEIHNHLSRLSEPYQVYSNSEDHFQCLAPELNGAIYKLHGDLRSDNGLVLTANHYNEIGQAESWLYWRTKLTSVFQMQRVVVLGHSLSDSNIKHVLQAAKRGGGIVNPICWIAPDVSPQESRELLDNYRIRVVSYDNQDGKHKNLTRLIESITDFVPPRTTVRIQQQIAKISQQQLGQNAAAPGFFVFNRLASRMDFDEKRIDIVMAAIQATLPRLATLDEFDLETTLKIAGWPENLPLPGEIASKVRSRSIEQGLLLPVGIKFKIGERAQVIASENQRRFEHMRERFKQSLVLRLKREYPMVSDSDVSEIASDIESSISGYFREGGLSLATTLFAGLQSAKNSNVPSSIIKFIREASARYDSLLKRQAFFTVSLNAFIHAESAEREYLGKVSQGFFAFHALGVFGEVAIERLRHAKETVWLVDSNAQIPALALASPTNAVFLDCFSRLRNFGIRLFTTEGLFQETREHLWFAQNVIKESGPDSLSVMAAATGQAPYRKSNEFLAGFIRWQAAGNPCDWGSYLFRIFDKRDPNVDDIKSAIRKMGIEVVAFRDWPGFSEPDYSECEECNTKIKQLWLGDQQVPLDQTIDLDKKVKPEGEACLIVRKERTGNYHILTSKGQKSHAWFLSDTSVLNAVEEGSRITWQTDAFLRFVSTLTPADTNSADRAFETLLWEFVQSGLSLLDDKEVISTFGGVIDQATIDLTEQLQKYEGVLSEKYGESTESVLARIPAINRPLAALQIAKEAAQIQTERAEQAQADQRVAVKRANDAEKQLARVEKFRKKMVQKEWERQSKKRKNASKGKRKKG